MDGSFYSLHEFMVHTKAITYILIVIALVGLTWWWGFLTKEDEKDPSEGEQ